MFNLSAARRYALAKQDVTLVDTPVPAFNTHILPSVCNATSNNMYLSDS